MRNRHQNHIRNETTYQVAGISRQGYFKQKHRQEKEMVTDQKLKNSVAEVRKKHPRMGSRSIHYHGTITEMGVTKFEQWMSMNALTIAVRRKRIVTTRSGPGKTYPNLIQGLTLTNINQLVAGDITYYQTKDKTYYIFTLKDLYSKRIVGITGSDNMSADNSIATLKQLFALRKGASLEEMIHHTDAGGQYKATAYLALQHQRGIQTSMAENCLQNGAAEQLNDVLKNHYLFDKEINNVRQLQKHLVKIVRLINEEKPVAELGYMTPVAFESHIKNHPDEPRPQVVMYNFNKS